MDTIFSTNHKFTRMFANILSFIAILAIALANTGFSTQAPQRPSTDNWDGSAVLKPSVLRETSSYKMWYDGVGFDGTTQVGLAKSRDGMSWNKSPQNPVLSGDPSAWDASGEHAPFVMKDGDLYKMWYEGFDGNVRQLGYATSPDGVNWTKYEGNPVLRAEPGYDEVVAGHGSVLYEDGMYKLWYHAVGDQGILIAFATSLDGVNWTKEGPVLLQETGNWDEFGLWGPSVLKVSGIYWMWYSASGPDPVNPVSIGLATSADGINWERYGEGPVVTDPNGGFIGDPTVINDSGLFKMWYGNFGDGTIYYAESENGFDWTEPMPALFPWIDVQAGNASPFVGHWQAIDVDGSDIRLVISGPPNGPFQITWTESYISYCGGEAGILRGVGWFSEEDFNPLEADVHLECFTTGRTLDFHLTFRYHPTTNTLSTRYDFGDVTIWHRPGGGQVEEPPALGLRVNYGHDWVESFYEGGHTAWITVTDGDGNLKATAELVTEPKDYWGGETGFQTNDSVWFDAEGNQLEYPPDIQPYDWIYGWVDNGASAQVQIGEVNGAVHLADDYIEGTIYAPWFSDELEVDCHSWGAPLPEEILKYDTVLPNGEDPYICSWADEWDIQPYQDIGVGYSGPDGHWVANAIIPPNPRIVASEAGDWFWVTEFYPGLLDLFIYESADEGAALLWSDQQEAVDLWGITSVGYDLHGQDMVPGNYLVVSDGVNSKGLVLQPISVTMFDTQYDFMSGVAPAGSEVWAAAGLEDWQERIMVEADPGTGEWFANFAGIGFDITEEMQPWSYASIYDEDGDANEGSVPPLEFWVVAYTYDLPAGTLTDGSYPYHFELEWSFPEPGVFSGQGGELDISSNAPVYDGYVLLRGPSELRGINYPEGLSCEEVGQINPNQPIRFLIGWLPDYGMTYLEAQTYFESLTGNVFWGDGMSAELTPDEIMPFSFDDLDAWFNYVCTFTEAPPKMDLRVNYYGHDWVESFYEAGHKVVITVTDEYGNIKATAIEWTESKDFWGGETGFQTNPEDWVPAPPDLQPNDWVYAQVDNGATAKVQLGDIQGEVRFDLNSITGTINVPWLSESVPVECLDWGSGGEPINKDAGSVNPDGASPYNCIWDPETEWDVQPWQDIGVGYFTPDGHWVANAFRDERWMAFWTYTPDLPTGFFAEGEHSYYYQWAYTAPVSDSGISGPRAITIAGDPIPIYDWYALIGPWGLYYPGNFRPQLAWTGSACEEVSVLHPNQPMRFVWGWVNDYSMTYEEALTHFSSFTIDVFWDFFSDGITDGSATLATMSELIPFTGRDARFEHLCTLTEHP